MPSTIFMYIFHMAYLGGGYYFKQTTGYDINWTMPGCVLCLRLIGNVQLFVNLIIILYARWRFKSVKTKLALLAICRKI